MKKILRWLLVAVAGVAVLAGAVVSIAYLATEPLLRRTYESPLRSIAVPDDPESIAEGRRLATIRGCFDGCHGKGVGGAVFWEEPWIARVVAPDLTRIFAQYTNAELERVIRRGVRRDGTSIWVMSSNMFYHLADEDLGKIIAFIRSLPAGNGPDTEFWLGPLGRLMMVVDPMSPLAEEIERDAPWTRPEELAGEHGQGRYLALTVCTECHGMDLAGAPDGTAPDLVVAVGYTEGQFAHLMKTGEPIGDRQLDLMALVARKRFSQMTDAEVRALYNYLLARAREPK